MARKFDEYSIDEVVFCIFRFIANVRSGFLLRLSHLFSIEQNNGDRLIHTVWQDIRIDNRTSDFFYTYENECIVRVCLSSDDDHSELRQRQTLTVTV